MGKEGNRRLFCKSLARLVPTECACASIRSERFEESPLAWIEDRESGKIRIDLMLSLTEDNYLSAAPTLQEIVESIAANRDVGSVELRLFLGSWTILCRDNNAVEIAQCSGINAAMTALRLWKKMNPGAAVDYKRAKI